MSQCATAKHYTYRRRQPEDTLLYKTLAANVETFIADRETEGRPVPERVAKELRDYLTCGILQYGFVLTFCPSCPYEAPVGFSCKGRGFCPSCFGKRMAEAVEHLVDHVLPHAAYRQWVLTFPFALRFWLAANNRLLSKVNKIATSEISKFYATKAKAEGVGAPLPGAITFIQRSGSALNAALHLHILALEGVYATPEVKGSAPRLHALTGPSDDDVADVVEKISKRTIKLLRRHGYLDNDAEFVMRPDADDMFQDNDAITAALGASVQSKIAFGPRAGQFVRKIGKGFGFEEEAPLVKSMKCATINGFNLQAATFVGATDRRRLEELVAYMTRPPLATSRLSVNENGDLVYAMKRVFSDGTRAVILSPMELIEKLCAMVPPARAHQCLYTGVFSSHSQWRNLVVLDPKARKGFNPETVDKKKVKNHRRAKLLKRIFSIDVGTCPKCGDDMEIRSAVHDQENIQRYMRHLGLPEHPPTIAPPRYEQGDLDQSFNEAQGPPPQDEVQETPPYP
jgi:hypothetical protein